MVKKIFPFQSDADDVSTNTATQDKFYFIGSLSWSNTWQVTLLQRPGVMGAKGFPSMHCQHHRQAAHPSCTASSTHSHWDSHLWEALWVSAHRPDADMVTRHFRLCPSCFYEEPSSSKLLKTSKKTKTKTQKHWVITLILTTVLIFFFSGCSTDLVTQKKRTINNTLLIPTKKLHCWSINYRGKINKQQNQL